MTSTRRPEVTAPWLRINTGEDSVAVAERGALGTSARVAVWPPEDLDRALTAVEGTLNALDLQASRFRQDSEISWIHRGTGGLFMLSDGLTEAISIALEAARWTRGLVDPTVGNALIALGYDRDFAAIDPRGDEPPSTPQPVPGWQRVRLNGPLLELPAGVRLDLGATAKGLGADRAVRAVRAARGQDGGVLVNLGGDLAVAGQPPSGGWPILVAGPPEDATPSPPQLVRLIAGAVATSSSTCRRWRRGGRLLHHIVDPRTGLPADGPWQMVSAAGLTCADANAAATAAIVAGDRAVDWLATAGVPARLVARDGTVRYVGGWPETVGGLIEVPPVSQVYGGFRPRGGAR